MMLSSVTASAVLLASGVLGLAASSKPATPKFTSNQYSGAVYDGVLPYYGLVFSAVGTVTVPGVHLPAKPDIHTTYSGSAAVGMVGWECPGTFVSAGVTWTVRNKTVEYSAYLTNGSQPVVQSSVKVSKGDQVQLYAMVFGGGGAAQATVDNLSTGQSQNMYFSTYNYPVTCNRTAQWTVSDPATSDGKVSFAAFDSVNFTDAYYESFDSLNGVENRGLTNVTAINLVNKSKAVLAAGSITNSSTVKVTYKKSA